MISITNQAKCQSMIYSKWNNVTSNQLTQIDNLNNTSNENENNSTLFSRLSHLSQYNNDNEANNTGDNQMSKFILGEILALRKLSLISYYLLAP